MACRWRSADRKAAETLTGVTGRSPWSPLPLVQARRPAPHLGTRKSRTHKTSHRPRACLSTRAVGPTATPKPGDGGSESGAQTCRPEPRPLQWGSGWTMSVGEGEKALRAPVWGVSLSGALPPGAPGEDVRGPLGSRQGEGAVTLVTHTRAFNIPSFPYTGSAPRPRRFPAVCGCWRPLHTRLARPIPGSTRWQPGRGPHHSGPVLWANPQGTKVCFSVLGAHCCRSCGMATFRIPASSVSRQGHNGKAGKVPLLLLHWPVPQELTVTLPR